MNFSLVSLSVFTTPAMAGGAWNHACPYLFKMTVDDLIP